MDACLAAVAIMGGMRLATLEKDFRSFEAEGLGLPVLSPGGQEFRPGVW